MSYAPPPASTQGDWHSFYPLLAFNSPEAVWRDNPSYLCGEIMMTVLVAWITFSALFGSGSSTRTRFVWAACFTAGGTIELLTIMNKQVGNFYHSQAVIMLFGLREPFYMLFGCYIPLQYLAVELAALGRRRLTPLAEASLAALLGRSRNFPGCISLSTKLFSIE